MARPPSDHLKQVVLQILNELKDNRSPKHDYNADWLKLYTSSGDSPLDAEDFVKSTNGFT